VYYVKSVLAPIRQDSRGAAVNVALRFVLWFVPVSAVTLVALLIVAALRGAL
jgi:hypothetical protein